MLYSLLTGSARCERQWAASIDSLRFHNPDLPVYLSLYGRADPQLLAQAARQRVTVTHHPSYARCLAIAGEDRAQALTSNPTLHKIASMRDVPDVPGQLLYLDCDTFCFGDLSLLFDRYQDAHFHAREEPGSRRSPHGYDRGYIDEDALQALASRERLVFVPPYNSGVMMLNGGLWSRLGELFAEFLDFVWRLSAQWSDPVSHLPLPTSNGWIVEEVATWLTLGRFPELIHDRFVPMTVAQNGEAAALLATGRPPLLAHYFSAGEVDFRAALRSHGELVA